MTHFLLLCLIRGSSYGFFLSIPFGARQILFFTAECPAENKNTDLYLLQQCLSGFNQNAVLQLKYVHVLKTTEELNFIYFFSNMSKPNCQTLNQRKMNVFSKSFPWSAANSLITLKNVTHAVAEVCFPTLPHAE